MNSSAIRASGLTKRYGETVAVDGLDLDIAPGEFFGLLGPNGSGKTTTIHMLATLIRATSGSAQVAVRH
jgi:ABC-2 type transport system ATP-binding protein